MPECTTDERYHNDNHLEWITETDGYMASCFVSEGVPARSYSMEEDLYNLVFFYKRSAIKSVAPLKYNEYVKKQWQLESTIRFNNWSIPNYNLPSVNFKYSCCINEPIVVGSTACNRCLKSPTVGFITLSGIRPSFANVRSTTNIDKSILLNKYAPVRLAVYLHNSQSRSADKNYYTRRIIAFFEANVNSKVIITRRIINALEEALKLVAVNDYFNAKVIVGKIIDRYSCLYNLTFMYAFEIDRLVGESQKRFDEFDLSYKNAIKDEFEHLLIPNESSNNVKGDIKKSVLHNHYSKHIALLEEYLKTASSYPEMKLYTVARLFHDKCEEEISGTKADINVYSEYLKFQFEKTGDDYKGLFQKSVEIRFSAGYVNDGGVQKSLSQTIKMFLDKYDY